MSDTDSDKWIAYHLEAMNYANKGLDIKMAKLPSGQSLNKLEKPQLKIVIADLKKYIVWYKEKIEYHQAKAMKHIPMDKRRMNAQAMRQMENASYEKVFITGNDMMLQEAKGAVFETHEDKV